MKYHFVVNMMPMGKERPRTTTKGGELWAYTPTKTRKAEAKVREFLEGKGVWFADHVGVKMEATFYRPAPDSPTVNSIQQICRQYQVPFLPVAVGGIDWDQYGKLLSDALQTYCYRDDSQVTTALIKKRYCKGDASDPPRIDFTLEEDDGT